MPAMGHAPTKFGTPSSYRPDPVTHENRKSTDSPSVSEVLRRAIEARLAAGETLYRIAKDAGVAWRVVQRFVTGERSELRSGTVDRLCASLGLVLKPDDPSEE